MPLAAALAALDRGVAAVALRPLRHAALARGTQVSAAAALLGNPFCSNRWVACIVVALFAAALALVVRLVWKWSERR